MGLVEFIDEILLGKSQARGSDGRLNTSSRSDGRIYYNSRDRSESYTLVFDDAACSAGDFNVSLFNAKTDGKQMIIHTVEVSALALASFKLHLVTGTAAGGAVEATPLNLNRAGRPNKATVIASTVANSDSSAISGLVSAGVFSHKSIGASDHADLHVEDTLRLGEGQGIAIEMDSGANATRVFGTIVFYFEIGRGL